ncbi:AMP-dependent synthetase/ligase [Corchorus capsularis]|uniref:4-coumarate--CoA ligase n=1 Tax=Corchorus capsularis TaxID=210143 RepID=A0A1R3IZ28_COCAP|nr:AMP-dependent synthetase/ligase [Corchorus capsularis]
MATSLNSHFSFPTSESKTSRFPDWYSPETGIYTSKHASVSIPTDPYLDVVSFIFSHQHQGVTAFIDSSSGYSISYSKLLPLVQSMASGLHHLGVSKGDVVLLLLPNSLHYPIIFFSVLYLGAIVTPMNPLSSMSEIKKQIADSNVCFAFTLLETVDKLEKLGVHAIGVPENMNLDSEKVDFSPFYKLMAGQSGNKAPRPVIKQQDTAAIMYSSGTTGTSKGVVLTHGNFIAMIELFVKFEASQYEYPGSENVYLAALPMFHIYGLSLFVVGLLSLGSTVVVMRKFNAGELVKVIDKYGITHFPVVPPILTALTMSAKGVYENYFKSLKQVSCGAAPTSRKSIEDFVQAFPHVDFIQGYGMTESTAVGTRGFNTGKHHKYSSIGLLAPNMQAKVVDLNSGSSMPPGDYGELWASFWDSLILYSLAIYIIAPADLEAILITHPEILDAAVTGAIDEACGEIPVAFVVRRHGCTLTHGAVMDFVAKQVAPYKKVRKVVFTNSIPRSAAGKILRRELKKFLSSRL